MGELWRSQEMQLVQLYVQIEAAHDTVDELGHLGLVQFRDLNPSVNSFQRNFVSQVKRADEMQRKLRYLENQIVKVNEEALVDGLKEQIKIEESKDDEQKVHMDELEAKFDELEKQIVEMNGHQDKLNHNYNQLIELKYVLIKDESFFAEALKGITPSTDKIGDESLVKLDEEAQTVTQSKLGFISGVIERDSLADFEKVLYRATRGNLFMKWSEIERTIKDPDTGKVLKKAVFIIFFPGTQLQIKIKKICEAFKANLYPCPDTQKERELLLSQVETRLQDLKILLEKGWDQRSQVLSNIAVHLNYWKTKVSREKAIYHTMNMFNYDHGRKCLIAEGWCPTNATEQVQLALRAARERSGALVPSILNIIPARSTPPTYFKTNKYTAAFQSIVDSYGIARYGEVNPAVLTIITFPFEFGCMFGDFGHGILLLIFALLLIKQEKNWEGKKISEMIEIPYYGRYALFLMSLFSIYMGALYNETFAVSINFGSNWQLQYGPDRPNNTFERVDNSWSYAFGVDPIWKGATNELIYYNSLKMKMSIIIGVIQMSVGLVLHLLNGIHFKNWLDVFFEFIPKFCFLQSIFGYLCFMIFYKWNVDYMAQDENNRINGIVGANATGENAGTAHAPVLLNELIYMFLPGGPTSNPLYAGQYSVQPVLVIIALISVPLMMFPKPLIMRYQHNQQKKYTVVHHGEEMELTEHVSPVAAAKAAADKPVAAPAPSGHGGGGHGHGHGEEFDFGELMVHQTLETIEFVLGSVSHTASYLRLWALSLAHSELATVFYDKIFAQSLEIGVHYGVFVTGILAFVGFSAWFFATLMVLMFMESLSAFLHALRLHWYVDNKRLYLSYFRRFLQRLVDIHYDVIYIMN
eukprot:TRINITY_DN2492_c0_g1_i3.p1 TRINITY_DN2492_c0_g1~~TRINITY_DN2492_c0_g1_i3.p1  ORF type:complete len:866 (-),score=210.00 TRINITY_DN2492_c0_g1_i3:33-2630(-)